MEFSSQRISPPLFTSRTIFPMFSSPGSTMAAIKENPPWLGPLLVAAAYSLLVNFYVIERIGFSRLMSAALQSNVAIDPQSVLETALARRTEILVFQGLSTFIGTCLTAFVVAKVLWLLLAVAGLDIVFKKVLAVETHVLMVLSVIKESMLAITATVMQDLNSFDLRNPLATNPGFFFRPVSPVAFRLLAALDLFTLAHIFLLALGLSKVTSRLSFRTASVLILMAWCVYLGSTLLMPSFP